PRWGPTAARSLSTREFGDLVLPAQLAGCARRGWHCGWRDHGQIRIRATALREQAVAQIEHLSLRGHRALLHAPCSEHRQGEIFEGSADDRASSVESCPGDRGDGR